MIVKLTDGTTLSSEQVFSSWGTPEDGLHVRYWPDPCDQTKEAERVLYADDARRVRAMEAEFTIDRKDLTPDDVAHIEHPGMAFAEMLRLLRGESTEGPGQGLRG